MNKIGERIFQIRTNSETGKLSMASFAKKIGVSAATINQWEKGVTIPPKPAINTISNVFGINKLWLERGEGDMVQPMSEEQEIAQIQASLFNEDDQRRINLFKFIASLDEEDMEALERLWVKANDFFKKGE